MQNGAVGLALLTCDAVAHEPSTGKITLYGIFDRIFASTFPALHPQFVIYWRCRSVTPGRLGVSILRPDGSVLIDLEPPVEIGKDADHVAQGSYTLGAVQFPTEGEYIVNLRYNREEVMRTSLFLERKETG